MTKDSPLQVGVIGLGRRWQKWYKPALASLHGQFQVRFVGDAVHQRAVREAERIGAEAALGPGEMFEHGIDALVLVDPQWYGLWPIEVACQAGKPVFCAAPLESDDAHADGLLQKVQDRRLPVLMGMALRSAPVLAPLRELLDGELGAVRLLLCDRLLPARRGSAAGPFALGTAVVDCSLSFLEGEPVAVRAFRAEAAGLGSFLLGYDNGRAVGFRWYSGPVSRPSWRLRWVAERGDVESNLGRRMAWTTAAGRHVLQAPKGRPVAQVLLERFARVVRGHEPVRPSLADAHRALCWLRQGVRPGG
jgi:predicted dehydrogenase